jgi:FSR family fosmidomycin resistance protein-like MFS transporter
VIGRLHLLYFPITTMSIAGFIFLLIEFFDEFNYALEGAALPLMRSDLTLNYAQVGLLLGLPHIIGTLIEPVLMLLGDTRLRKPIILGGGIAVALSLLLIAGAASFPVLLLAMVISFPASGAFVTLSQATLMDQNRGRKAQMMARWTLAGSLGNLVGPLLLSASLFLGGGWRVTFILLALLALILVMRTRKMTLTVPTEAQNGDVPPAGPQSARGVVLDLLTGLWQALRDSHFVRWIILLQVADLMLDVYTSYLPLYFTDVVRVSPAQVALLLSLFTLAGLVSDVILLPMLERFPGRRIVRLSALVVGGLYVAWLLVPWLAFKICLVIVIKLVTLGWYPVLQAEAYAALPQRSGTVMAATSMGGLLGGIIVWLIGAAAQALGLPTAMWLLLLGPVCLLMFVPRPTKNLF